MSSKDQEGKGDEDQCKALADSAKRFYSTGTYSDLVIKCNGQQWKVHKFQVCAQSEFFHKACSGEFKEKRKGEVDLKDDDAKVVGAMLHYLYHGDYEDPDSTLSELLPLVLDIKIFAIADKYLIHTPKTHARIKFEAHCVDGWKSEGFALAVREIHDQGLPDMSMMNAAIKVFKQHANEYLTKKDEYKSINEALESVPGFGATVLTEMAVHKYDFGAGKDENKHEGSTWNVQCPNCYITFSIRIPVADTLKYSCPTGCYHNRDRARWRRFRV